MHSRTLTSCQSRETTIEESVMCSTLGDVRNGDVDNQRNRGVASGFAFGLQAKVVIAQGPIRNLSAGSQPGFAQTFGSGGHRDERSHGPAPPPIPGCTARVGGI